MTAAAVLFREQRNFGRREANIRGRANLPGKGAQPFTIHNISDGGALLVFDTPLIPGRSFRIEIDDTDLVVLCEVRHQQGDRVGVSFMRASEGVALNRHFQRRRLDGFAAGPGEPPPRARTAPRVSSQDLRAALRAAPPANAPEARAPAMPPQPTSWTRCALEALRRRLDQSAGIRVSAISMSTTTRSASSLDAPAPIAAANSWL